MAKYVKSKQDETMTVGESASVADDPIRLRFPALVEYLTLDRWEDGRPRVPSTLLILSEDGLWKGCVNDRDGGRSLWCSSTVFERLLERLEAGLCGDGGEWRRRSQEQRRGRR